MIRVVINGRFLTQVQTGVQRYARETLLALDELLAQRADLTQQLRCELAVPADAQAVPVLQKIMDASTTALSVARHLKASRGWSQLTVITNGLRIASELAGHPGITVLMLGGRVRWEALSVVGQLGDGLFRRVNVQKAFLGAAGFTPESGLADATEEEAQIKRSMVAAAREVIAIVDHTKWERAAFATFCPTDRISIVLTDEAAPEAMVQALIDRGVQIRLIGSDRVVEPIAAEGSGATSRATRPLL